MSNLSDPFFFAQDLSTLVRLGNVRVFATGFHLSHAMMITLLAV